METLLYLTGQLDGPSRRAAHPPGPGRLIGVKADPSLRCRDIVWDGSLGPGLSRVRSEGRLPRSIVAVPCGAGTRCRAQPASFERRK